MAEGSISNRGAGLLQGVRVLSVDDDLPSARLVAAIVEHEGAVARVATSAEEALEILPAFDPDVVVLDLVLPRMSGQWLARHIKADPARKDLILVSVSVIDPRDAAVIAREIGFNAHMSKPVDTRTFVSQLVGCLGGDAGGAGAAT
jgi:CheY-like chemotaxis protein